MVLSKIPDWTIMGLTGIIGFLVLAVITFKVIPEKQRLTFLLAGLTGGVTGYVMWLKIVGRFLLP